MYIYRTDNAESHAYVFEVEEHVEHTYTDHRIRETGKTLNTEQVVSIVNDVVIEPSTGGWGPPRTTHDPAEMALVTRWDREGESLQIKILDVGNRNVRFVWKRALRDGRDEVGLDFIAPCGESESIFRKTLKVTKSSMDQRFPEWLLSTDPGVQDLLFLLYRNGYETTDSGDGSKYGVMEGALDCPHVFGTVPEEDEFIAFSHHLLEDLKTWGYPDASVEVNYSPNDNQRVFYIDPRGRS